MPTLEDGAVAGDGQDDEADADTLAGDAEDALTELVGRLTIALRWLQSLDPVGVGARSLQECLVLGLMGKPIR